MPPAKTQSKTYKLIEPVEFAGIEYTELTFKKLKGKHLLEMGSVGDNAIEQSFALIAASAGIDVGVVHEMAIEDVMAVQEIIAGFFPQGLKDSIPGR
jgi:hypothetical protein